MKCRFCGKEFGESRGAKGMMVMHIKHKHQREKEADDDA